MRLVLKGKRRLELETRPAAPRPKGLRQLRVLFCAVCRTDAKMWDEGHRDLLLPRVPGHEVVVEDEAGRRFAVWPGSSCGKCAHCRGGRENLCDSMEILGFHRDGGFASELYLPTESLVPLPDGVPPTLACLAEPTGCVLHALDALRLGKGDRIAVYGGGTLGLITALASRELGAEPTVIERSAQKIDRAAPFLRREGIACVQDTTVGAFDAALTACSDPAAFNLAVVKLAKGGRLSFFSGLRKNERLESNVLNLLHYREARVHGAYGLQRKDVAEALAFIGRHAEAYEHLVQAVIPLGRVPGVLEEVLSGEALRYVVDLGLPWAAGSVPEAGSASLPSADAPVSGDLPARSVDALAGSIRPPDPSLRPAAQRKIDEKTKPLGALGTLEDLAVQLCLIQGTLSPRLERKAVFVFAGDHGVAEEGVSAFPAEVTPQMVLNFLSGGAAINVLCRHHGIDLLVVDMGVAADFEPHPALLREKIRPGTRNFAVEPAMTREEALRAVGAGAAVFRREHARAPIQILGLGELGIANTTSASAIISAVTGIPPEEATGRGTGVDDEGLRHKVKVIEKALRLHRPDPRAAVELLRTVGGYEIAGIVGAVLAAAAERTAVVLDGLISTAGGLLACVMNEGVKGYLISGHRSVEGGQRAALKFLGIEPVVDYRMRLGEGTGAAMAIDVADIACRILAEMASFDGAGVSKQV